VAAVDHAAASGFFPSLRFKPNASNGKHTALQVKKSSAPMNGFAEKNTVFGKTDHSLPKKNNPKIIENFGAARVRSNLI